MKILFTGGGTGGHLMPIVAIGRELRKLYPQNDLKLHYIGPKDDSGLLFQENFVIHEIVSGKIRRYFSFQNIIDILFNIPLGFIQSFFLLLFIRPKLVFSKGGSSSLVVCLAAKVLRIPVFLHESDSVPGLSNQKISKWAKKIFIAFENTEFFEIAKTILVGNPIRKELLDIDEKKAGEVLDITFERPVLLFWGGSQGAETINEFVLSILNELLKEYEIIHVSGNKNYIGVKLESRAFLNENEQRYYHLYKSLNELELKSALKVCNFIISRAGAGSIFEIAAVGKPSILIPLSSSAGNHQSKNAYQYAKTGAAIVIEQQNLTPNFFLGEINYLLSQPQILEKMRESALKFSKPMAAEEIAKEILEFI